MQCAVRKHQRPAPQVKDTYHQPCAHTKQGCRLSNTVHTDSASACLRQHRLPIHAPQEQLAQVPCSLLQLERRLPRLRLARILGTSAVIEIPNLVTVKCLLLEPLIDDIVREAQPACGSVPARHLRRVLGQQLAEVFGALAAWVQAGEERDEGLEG